jgi:hypothetical protein
LDLLTCISFFNITICFYHVSRIPSVIAIILIPASAASIMASAAKAGGTK